MKKWKSSLPVVSDSLRPHGLYSPWNCPCQNTGVGSLSLLQGIFPTQGSNPGLLHCRWILYCLSHQGSRDENSTLKVWNQEILRAWLDAPAAGMAAGDSSRKGMSLVQAVLRARGRGSSYLREMCGQNKLVNHLRSSSHNEGPKKQKTFFSENIHRQGNSLEVPWLGLLCFHCTEHRFNLRPGSWDLTC